MLVGRDEAADLVVSDPSVSRRHLLLRPGAEGWRWRDLGSKNGTRRLDAAPDAPLTGTAWLSLGGVLLRAETAAAPPARVAPEEVLGDLLPLTGAAGVCVWEGDRVGPPRLSVGTARDREGAEAVMAFGDLTLAFRGVPERAAGSATERDLVHAIARQALLLARAERARADIAASLNRTD